MVNLLQYKQSLEGFADEILCERVQLQFENHTKNELVISVLSRKIIEILETHLDNHNVDKEDALSQVWDLLNCHIKISLAEFMDTPDANPSHQKVWPYFSHSAMMMKLQKFNEMYKDDSLWEMHSKHGKIFSKGGRQILESIWNGLFCLGTKFPENTCWENEYLHEFIGTVKKLCAFPGMQRCFKECDEIRERRKILFELFKSIKKNELHQYTSHRSDTLSIQAVIIIQMLKNLRETSMTGEPPVNIGSFVYMGEEEIETFKSEVENLISAK